MKMYRMNKINLLFGICFSAFAVIVLIVNVFILIRWFDFKKDCGVAEAVIIDIKIYHDRSDNSESHSVMVEYIVDGEIYRGLLEYYSSSMREGQYVNVYYDPEDPSHTMTNPVFASLIMLILILAFGGVGGGFLIYELRYKKLVTALIAEDKYIVCDHTVERVETSANVTVNHVRYRQMDFIYHAPDGKEYTFSSRPYHPNKNPFIDGQNVIVYVDIEKNPKRYYVSEDK